MKEEPEVGCQYFWSYKHSDIKQFPHLEQIVPFMISNAYGGFLDVFAIPDNEEGQWKSKVDQAIEFETAVLINWSIAASYSVAIQYEIELAIKKNAYLIFIRLDDTPIPEITCAVSITHIKDCHPVTIAEELILTSHFLGILFTPDLVRRPFITMIRDLHFENIHTLRQAARVLSRYGNWHVEPAFIEWLADYIIDLPMLDELLDDFDGFIPLTIEHMKSVRNSKVYKKLLNN